MLSPTSRSPLSKKSTAPAPSPSYFGFVAGDDSIPPDSNPGHHARQNWELPTSAARSTGPAPTRQMSLDQNPEYEAFRRQSEQQKFNLNQNVSGVSRPQSRTSSSTNIVKKDTPLSPFIHSSIFDGYSLGKDGHQDKEHEQKSFFDIPRQNSPISISPIRGVEDHQLARLSLPSGTLQTPPLDNFRQPPRSNTLPSIAENGVPTMVSPKQFAELMERMPSEILLLDLRVYPQYAASRLRGALNLCIPTTLLKRPSFTVQKLADTFASDQDKDEFAKWRYCSFIVVYDANSSLSKEAVVAFNVLKKFTSEGWRGQGLVIKGGYLAFSKIVPGLVDQAAIGAKRDSKQTLSISPSNLDCLPIAGGCSMPSSTSAANPFFGNIRQNMDLLDGVGQMPIKHPSDMSERSESALPAWLRTAAKESDAGKLVSERFLAIEKSEQKRMQDALTCHVSYGTPGRETPGHIQVAGIEKGSKNRYNNIFPYDHTRVRLQNVPQGGCDYFNASHVKASYSNRRYISTQAPIPATFTDFWRVIWEQDVRVIVMLTAEKEGGQVKAHPYWNPGEFGPLKLKKLSEKRVSLQSRDSSFTPAALRRPSMVQRRSTNPAPAVEKKIDNPASTDPPSVIVRHFTLSHSSLPFQPMREITQLQYSQWPDFGAPAEPTALLDLIEQMNLYVRGSSSPRSASSAEEPAPEGQRPIIVHCSAGCGRTGTFCAIDSVIDMLKRQRSVHAHAGKDLMEVDVEDDWVRRDDIDLVAKTVGDFRQQRLSMVQNLRQFVLCYESILQWIVRQQPESMKLPRDAARRSYQG
jgi:tyrosine-protein phosphatase 2/3